MNEYLAGYSQALDDVKKILVEQRTSTSGNGDPIAIWWGKYHTIMSLIAELGRAKE